MMFCHDYYAADARHVIDTNITLFSLSLLLFTPVIVTLLPLFFVSPAAVTPPADILRFFHMLATPLIAAMLFCCLFYYA